MRYVYIKSEPGLYTVGFYKPDGKWEAESDHEDREEAAKRVHYLNGGAQADEIFRRIAENAGKAHDPVKVAALAEEQL